MLVIFYKESRTALSILLKNMIPFKETELTST